MNAVRLAASSGVRPRAGQRPVGPLRRGRRGRRRPLPARPRAAGRRGAGTRRDPGGPEGVPHDEARRDGRPCPRDPRGAWPAMTQSEPPVPRPSRHRSPPVRFRACSRPRRGARDDPAVRGDPVLAATGRAAALRPTGRLGPVRVRRFELRLVGAALVVGWTVAAALVLLAYRPGGPLDVLVGLTMAVPIAIAAAGTVWPPVTRGSGAFAAMVWLGHRRAALPGAVDRRPGRPAAGARVADAAPVASRRPTRGSSRSPATSLFSGLGISRRLRGAAALRRRRFADGADHRRPS